MQKGSSHSEQSRLKASRSIRQQKRRKREQAEVSDVLNTNLDVILDTVDEPTMNTPFTRKHFLTLKYIAEQITKITDSVESVVTFSNTKKESVQ